MFCVLRNDNFAFKLLFLKFLMPLKHSWSTYSDRYWPWYVNSHWFGYFDVVGPWYLDWGGYVDSYGYRMWYTDRVGPWYVVWYLDWHGYRYWLGYVYWDGMGYGYSIGDGYGDGLRYTYRYLLGHMTNFVGVLEETDGTDC